MLLRRLCSPSSSKYSPYIKSPPLVSMLIKFLFFFSYTLFPLLLLLDAAVACRSEGGGVVVPYRVSDKVAEGVVSCLEELLKKCHVGSVDQVSLILN